MRHDPRTCSMKTLLDAGRAEKVAEQLSRWVSRQSPKAAARTGGRTQIISPSLCHDALQRLGPSLQAHRGCDLIDINPGTCLWSRYLHDALKPRNHILIEPERKAFDRFITPLIEQKSQRYTHAATLPEALDLSTGSLSQDTVKNGSTEPRATLNNRLLLTVNTTRPIDDFNWKGTNTGHFLNDYYTSFWGLGHDVHRYGLIRVLAWVPEAHSSLLVPRTVDRRSRRVVYLEATSSVSEIAGTGWRQASGPFERPFNWSALTSESAEAVHLTESAGDIATPEARRSLPPLSQWWTQPGDLDLLRETPAMFHTTKMLELLAIDDRLKIDHPEWRDKAVHSKPRIPGKTADQKRWRALLTQRRSMYDKYLKTSSLVEQQRALEHRWRRTLLASEGAMNTPASNELEAGAKRIKGDVNKLERLFLRIGKTAIDDYRAYDSRPQALDWNQRPFEPLLVQPQEFGPANALSLVDIKPSPHFRERLKTDEECEIFDYVVGRLWQPRMKDDVHSALSALLQAGVEEFVQTCPSLKDPVQGGWYNLAELRLRSLPAQLYLDIALAWAKWPFRPPLQQLLLTSGANSRFQESEGSLM